MDNRKIGIEARPTFQFIKQVEDFITFTNNQLKDHRLRGLRPIQAMLDSISRTVQDPSGKLGVKPALKAYEETRSKLLGVPERLDKEYDKAVKEKQKADEFYNKLPQFHEENLNKQKRLLQAKVEDMNLDQLRAIGITAKENQQLIIKYEDLETKRQAKVLELAKLDRKIQGNCCGGPLCNKEDLIRRRNVDHEINVLLSLQAAVTVNPVTADPSKEEISDYKKQLDMLRQAIQSEIDGHEDKRKEARKAADAAAKKISDISQKMDESQLDQCRAVDRDTMFNLVHLRARLSNFNRLVDKVYQEDPSTRQVLDSLTSARNEWRDKINHALGVIFYPNIEGHNGLKFYSDYIEWDKTHELEQQKFESAEYSPNEYIDQIVPEMKKVVTPASPATGIGSVSSFFPSVSRARSMASTPGLVPPAAAPGIKASSSSVSS